jgi:thiamine-phosphate pyrophosphorylase
VTTAELASRLRLIVITDRDAAAPRSIVEVVELALRAGAPAIQLRDKTASARELYQTGRELLPLVRAAGALFFVNDRVDVALALGADGAHVGPDDLAVRSLRPAVPRDFLIGTSSDNPAQAQALIADGASYIGCGTVYPTTTKPDAGEVLGLEGLDRVARRVDAPVVGIGGVTPEQAAHVAGTAASGVAVVAAVMTARDVGEAVSKLLKPWSHTTDGE